MKYRCKKPCMGVGCYFTVEKLEPWMDHCGMSGEYGGIFELDIPQTKLNDFLEGGNTQ